jgi:hypothetical protein
MGTVTWAAVLAIGMGLATPADAQEPDLAIDGVVGAALPTGNAARASGAGVSFGFGIPHRLGGRLTLTTDVQLSRFYDGVSEQEGFGSSTDLRIWRITIGPALLLTSPRSDWRLRARAGLGIAGVRSGRLPPGSQEPQEPRDGGLNEDVFALTGGFELSRDFAARYTPFLRAQFDLYDMKHFMLGLSFLNPDIPPNGPLHAYSVQAGIRLLF